MADPQGHEEVDPGGGHPMDNGLEEGTVAENLILLVSNVHLGQLQALFITHVLLEEPKLQHQEGGVQHRLKSTRKHPS